MPKTNKDISRLKDLLIVLNTVIVVTTIIFFIVWYVTFPRLSSFLFWYGIIVFGILTYAHLWMIRFTVDTNALKKFIKKDVNL